MLVKKRVGGKIFHRSLQPKVQEPRGEGRQKIKKRTIIYNIAVWKKKRGKKQIAKENEKKAGKEITDRLPLKGGEKPPTLFALCVHGSMPPLFEMKHRSHQTAFAANRYFQNKESKWIVKRKESGQ